MAIQKGDIESILFLLSINVDVNSRVQDVNRTTPLHLAAKTGNEMLVRSLILAGARVCPHYIEINYGTSRLLMYFCVLGER